MNIFKGYKLKINFENIICFYLSFMEGKGCKGVECRIGMRKSSVPKKIKYLLCN